MGIIRRQGIKNSIVSWSGLILGYVNKVLLFSVFLLREQFGLLEFLIATGMIFGEIATIGTHHTILRFLPFLKINPKRLSEFSFYVLIVPLVGILFVCGLIFLFKPFVIAYFANPSSIELISKYYLFIIPITIFITYFNVFNAWSVSIYKTVIPLFIREVFLRLVQAMLAVLYFLKLIDFEQLAILFVLSFGVQGFALFVYLRWLKSFRIKFTPGIFKRFYVKVLMSYGLISFLATAATLLVQYIDKIMVLFLTGEFGLVAVYTVAYYFGQVIYVPAKAIGTIALPIVSTSLKNKDFKQVGDLYKRVSTINFIIGGLLLLLVWSNVDSLFSFLPEAYQEGKYIVLFIGISKLFTMINSMNGGIIIYSKHYKFNLYSNALLLVITVIANMIFIPLLGVEGAAIATLISMVCFNLMKFVFVWVKLKMSPYTKATIGVLAIFLAVYGLSLLIPDLENHWLDIILKSTIITIAFMLPVLVFRLSDDLNGAVQMMLKKLRK